MTTPKYAQFTTPITTTKVTTGMMTGDTDYPGNKEGSKVKSIVLKIN